MPDTVADSIATTEALPAGDGVTVTIDTLGDHDWYRVDLVAGTTYVFSTWAIPGQGPDTFLTLRDAAGTQILFDDDGGPGTYSTIRYTATTTGAFYIDAGTYEDGSAGNFRLTVATPVPTAGPDLVGADTATTGALTLGGVVAGRIDGSSDHDWYAITLTAGETYVFRTGPTTVNGSFDSILTVRDSAGVALAENDDTGGTAFSGVRFTATASGTYYLDISAFNPASTGNFLLTSYTAEPLTLFTNDQIANQLTDVFWGGESRHFNVTPGGTLTYNVTALTAEGAALAVEALALWSDVTGIAFQAVTTGGQIVFDDNQTGAFANSSVTGGIITSSTVNVGTAWLTTYGTGLNSYSFQTYIHEIGHAIGLGHAGNYNGSADYGLDANYLNDAWAPTVMSYFDQQDNTYFADLGFTRQFVLTPMIADQIATSVLYGTSTTTRTGNTIYGFNNNSGRAIYDATVYPTIGYTVHDSGGIDTLDYSGFAQSQRIDLTQESYSNVGGQVGNVAIARGTVIENAIGGSGIDTLIGNAANNILDGRGGADTMVGGAGNDIYLVDDLNDVVTELDGGGNDRVETSVAGYTLPAFVETLEYTGNAAVTATGNASNNQITGGINGDTLDGMDGDDTLAGEAGDDTLNGGEGSDRLFGGAGIDTMDGGAGNDRIVVDNAGDIAIGGTGIDTLQIAVAGISYTVAADIEIVSNVSGGALTATLNDLGNTYGGSNGVDVVNAGGGQDTVYGRAGDDVFNGEGANDYLYGEAGSDTLNGGLGNDYLYGGTEADVINGGAGLDTLYGGTGADRFVFAAGDTGATIATADRIFDFAQAQSDRIDLAAIDAMAGGADDAFSFIGNAAFGNVAGQLRYQQVSGATYVQGDTNGDGVADFTIRIDGLHALTNGDFFL